MEINNPIFCDIGITERCIFKCKMCKIWQIPENLAELSIAEWKDFIVSLQEFGTNTIRLHFAGGEPLLKKGILELVGFAHQKGFTTVMVTNGFLIDEPIAEEIVDSGLDVLSISLDTLDAATHDFLRGIEGAHDHAMRAIKFLNRYGAKSVTILAVIMGYNLDHLIELADWAQANNTLSSIYFQAISQPIAMPKDKRWYEKDEFSFLWPKDTKHLNYVIDRLIDYKTRGYKISNSVRQLETFKSYFKQPEKLGQGMVCSQGDYVMYIRPTGEVSLCGSLPHVGNIKTDSIKKLWDSQEASARRKQIHDCKESCLNVINCFEDKELP